MCNGMYRVFIVLIFLVKTLALVPSYRFGTSYMPSQVKLSLSDLDRQGMTIETFTNLNSPPMSQFEVQYLNSIINYISGIFAIVSFDPL